MASRPYRRLQICKFASNRPAPVYCLSNEASWRRSADPQHIPPPASRVPLGPATTNGLSIPATSHFSSRRRPRRTRTSPASAGAARRAQAASSQSSGDPTAASTASLAVPFNQLDLHPTVLSGVASRGFSVTTPIQAQAIPVVRRGGDLIACAETGTGKTAAFVLPLLDRLIRQREQADTPLPQRTRALILAPTRELAVQVDDDITGFAYHTNISSVVVCGGMPSDPQERALRAGVDIVVATPGRLMDHMRSGICDFTGLQVLVLDEADRMLDMGFWPDIQRIVEALPVERQTMLFSATMAGEVVTLANAVVRNPEMVGQPSANQLAPSIAHAIEEMPRDKKADWLAQFLRHEEGPVLVFVRTKRGADRLATRLAAFGIRCAALHADLVQQRRTSAVEGFRSGRFKALVATDLAARGLDIHGITHVINYDVPSTKEAYVHRVGRTGRADLTGTAITLVAPEERKTLHAIAREVGLSLLTPASAPPSA